MDHPIAPPTNEPRNDESNFRRSNIQQKYTSNMQESIRQGQVTAFSSYYDALHQDDYNLQDKMREPINFIINTTNDTMYYHQAMKAPNRKEFLKAMEK